MCVCVCVHSCIIMLCNGYWHAWSVSFKNVLHDHYLIIHYIIFNMMIKIRLNPDDQVHFKEKYLIWISNKSVQPRNSIKYFSTMINWKQIACLNMLMKNMIFFPFDTVISDIDIILFNMTSIFHKIFSS